MTTFTADQMQDLYNQYCAYEWEYLQDADPVENVELITFNTPYGIEEVYCCPNWEIERLKEMFTIYNPPAEKWVDPLWKEGFDEGYSEGLDEGYSGEYQPAPNPYIKGSSSFDRWKEGNLQGFINGGLDS